MGFWVRCELLTFEVPVDNECLGLHRWVVEGYYSSQNEIACESVSGWVYQALASLLTESVNQSFLIASTSDFVTVLYEPYCPV